MDLRVTNVVVSSNLNCTLCLNHITTNICNVIYNPRKYSGMIWKHKKINQNVFFSILVISFVWEMILLLKHGKIYVNTLD
jgi:TATA-box binding protein (TBP) (component of TFIID and TFIIIB)